MQKKITYLCSPNMGSLDAWLPVLDRVANANEDIEICCVLPFPGLAGQVSTDTALCMLADRVLTKVNYRLTEKLWLQANSFSELKSTLDSKVFPLAAMFRFVRGLERIDRVPGRWQRWLLAKSLRLVGKTKVVPQSQVTDGTNVLCFDLWELQKPYAQEIISALGPVPAFSLYHGCAALPKISAECIKALDLPAPIKAFSKSRVTAFLNGSFEREIHLKRYPISDSQLRVTGIPRHSETWIRKLKEARKSRNSGCENQMARQVFLVSRPCSNRLPAERKRATVLDLKKILIGERGLFITIKRHPKESNEGIYEEILGDEKYGVTWAYSDEHPFITGSESLFAITFYSMVSIDMIRIGTPVIEYLDLRGLVHYDNPEALRDGEGRPILEYRYSGFCLGVNDAEEFRAAVAKVLSSENNVIDELRENYRRHIPSDADASDEAAKEIIGALADQSR